MKEYRYFAFYLVTVIIARTLWLCGLTVNNRLGWIIAQTLLTIGQLVVFLNNPLTSRLLTACLSTAFGFSIVVLTWDDKSWYQKLITIKGFELAVLACLFAILILEKNSLFNVAMFLYFATLWLASHMGNFGALANNWPIADITVSLVILGSNILWFIFFRRLRLNERREA